MKALTICQPYPHLICLPESDPWHKRVENRTWPWSFRGVFAVHAGKGRKYLTREDRKQWPEMVFGAVVAVAKMADCFTSQSIERGMHDFKYPWLRGHRHVEGPWCFVLPKVFVLPSPVPCGGRLGPWELLPDVETRVLQQVDLRTLE